MEENETANESDLLRRNEDSILSEDPTHFGSLDQGRSRARVTDPFLQPPSVLRGSLDMTGQNEATLDNAENDVPQVKNFVQPFVVDFTKLICFWLLTLYSVLSFLVILVFLIVSIFIKVADGTVFGCTIFNHFKSILFYQS